MPPPSVFITILQYNNSQDTLRCLESLKELDYPNHKVVVVDNASQEAEVNNVKKFIESQPPKPNLFFLGPILKQSDLLHLESFKNAFQPEDRSLKPSLQKSDLADISYGPIDQELNPFAIRALKKPLQERIPDDKQKMIIKSTFDTALEEPAGEKKTSPAKEPEFRIRPYKPLQSHIP